MKTQNKTNMNELVSPATDERAADGTSRKQSLNLKVRTRVGMAARTQIQAGAQSDSAGGGGSIATHSNGLVE
jgi:hypothetical protein